MDINQAAEQIRNLCQDLAASKKAFILAESIEQSLTDMDDLRAADADTDCSACLTAIQKQLNEMIDLLTDSTIKQTDGLCVKAKTLKTRLLKATTHKKEDSKPITIIRAESDKSFDMPKIHIAKFNGGLEEWHVFWGRFRGAVHKNEKMAEHIKLAHLIFLVIDPALHDFMVTANDGTPGRYQEAVDYLQERFNRPRELHSIYCRKLSELQPIKGTPAELSAAADTVFAAVSGIRRSGQACIDQITTSLVAPILPDHLRALWENKTEEDPQVPHIDQWIAFVRKKATMADKSQKAPSSTSTSTRPFKDSKKPQKNYVKSEGKVYVASSQPAAVVESTPSKGRKNPASSNNCKVQCALCSTMHFVFQCRQFMEMTVQQRKNHVQSSSLCSNCLRPGHSLQDCQCSFRCRICKLQHNTLLHTDASVSTGTVNNVTQTSPVAPTNPQKKEKLMMTSQVLLTGPSGQQMVDTGAEVSVLSNRVMKNHQLKRLDEWMTLKGIEGPKKSTARPTAQITVSSPYRKNWSQIITVTVVPKVTADLPKHHLQSVRDLPHIKDLSLADPFFHEPRRVDLILDVDFMDSIMLPEKITGPPGTPSAWKTELGWGIMGRYMPNQLCPSTIAAVNITSKESADDKLDTVLERFWAIEELPKWLPTLSPQDTAVQEHYSTTHVFSPPAGRYVVTLPKRETTLQLGESRKTALNRYLRNEQSLMKKGNWAQFQAVVQEYQTLGHAQLVNPQELCIPVQHSYFLPMHAVFKSSSTSTKLKVVFDASCPTTSGASLNDILAAGPTLHPNLDTILICFRSYRVALSGDVGKMYREVMLCQPDRQLHRFLWRSHPDQPVADYCMNRVTFGVTSSPYAAVRTLQQTASDFSTPESKASWHVCQSFYVDDLLAGADTVSEAVQLYQQLRELLLKGGFELKKWRSSSPEVLKAIPSELQELLPQQEVVDNHSASYPKH